MYLKKYNLKNKIALVTGAGKGLGRACAIGLAEAGANLVIISRTKKDLDEVSKKIKKLKSKCNSYVCDITNYNEIKGIINKQTKTNTPPPIQNVKLIVSSIAPQLEARSVHHHGVNIWNNTDPIITAKNSIPGCIKLNLVKFFLEL